MKALHTEHLNSYVIKYFIPFVDEILSRHPHQNIHSIYLTGSAATQDFIEKRSDVNSLIVLKQMDFSFIKLIASLGKKYKKHMIAAPLVMTSEYITKSLDAFPIEFLELKTVHNVIYGVDLLDEIEINKEDLRCQCEREIKARMLGLSKGYISSLGDKDHLVALLLKSTAGYIPLFRAILVLMGVQPPLPRREVIAAFQSATGIDTEVFRALLQIKEGAVKPSQESTQALFERYYSITEHLGNVLNDLQA